MPPEASSLPSWVISRNDKSAARRARLAPNLWGQTSTCSRPGSVLIPKSLSSSVAETDRPKTGKPEAENRHSSRGLSPEGSSLSQG